MLGFPGPLIEPDPHNVEEAIENLARDLRRAWGIELGFTAPNDPHHGLALYLRPVVYDNRSAPDDNPFDGLLGALYGYALGSGPPPAHTVLRSLQQLRTRAVSYAEVRQAADDAIGTIAALRAENGDLRRELGELRFEASRLVSVHDGMVAGFRGLGCPEDDDPFLWLKKRLEGPPTRTTFAAAKHPAGAALEQFVGAMRAAGWTVDLGENGEAEVTPPPDYAERWRNESIEQRLSRAKGTTQAQREALPDLLNLLADLGIHVQHGLDGWLVATPGESILRKKWTALARGLADAGVAWDMQFCDGQADVVINRGREQVTGQVHVALLGALADAGVAAKLMHEDPPSWRVVVDQPARVRSAEPDVGAAQVRVTTGVNDEGQRETFVELSHEGQCRDFLADLLAGHAAKLHDRNEDRAEPRPEDQPDFYGDDVPDDGPTGVQCVWEGCSRTALYCKEHAVEMADYRNGVPRSPEVLEAKVRAYEAFTLELPRAVMHTAKLGDAQDTLRAALRKAEGSA